ncbi:MAG TPA: putative LPS assembly protein LptD [Flavobacteriales bacterium]|nr:putative LPS assembly protein LptD [Flavobacteriales bacterium]
MCRALSGTAQTLESEVRYSARDSMRYDIASQTVYLFGAATVKYGDVEMTADRIVFDFKNEETQAYGAPDSSGTVVGKPQFTQDGSVIEADSIRYNFKSKQGLIRQVRTQEQESWVSANLSKRHANGEVHSKGGMLTTCDRPNPHYHFKVSRMMVIPDDKIIAGPAYMKIWKIPTPLAIPFGMFPNVKGGSAGVLIPIWGFDQSRGYYLLNGGWYQPISDHMDLSVTGDIYTRGSWALRTGSRYKTRYRYGGNVDLSYSTLLNSDPEFPDFSRQRNFFIRWNHQVDPKASLTDRFTASVNLGTSQNFTNNFNSSTVDYLSNTFQSNIAWTHLWTGKPYNLAVNLRHSQNTLNRTFDITAPAVTFNLQRIFPFQRLRPVSAPARFYDQIGVNYTANFDNRLTTTEQQLSWDNLPALARNMKNGIRHTAAVTTTLKNKFVTLNPEIRLTDRMYFEQLRKTRVSTADTSYTVTDTVPRFAAPFEWSAGATLTSKIYGMYSFRGRRIKAIRHVLTPSVGFNYRPDQSTQIEGPFGTNGSTTSYSPYDIGIYGKPTAGESGTVNLGLIQNLEAKVRDGKAMRDSAAVSDALQLKKIKLFDYVGVTTSYDIFKDSLRWAPVNLAARTAFFNKLNVNVVSVWDPYAVDRFGQRIDRSERSVTGKLARMTYTNVALGMDLKSKRYGQAPSSAPSNDQQVVEESDPSKGARINFSVPWRLGVSYSYDLNRTYADNSFTDTQRQSVLFNGDLNVLKYWKLGFSSGYDLVAQEWTPTSLNLYWDLHCWEFNFNIIPLGVRKSFSFRINVKASILRDLKFEQRRPYGNDNNLLY